MRLSDWRTRLAAHIAAHARLPFRPGSHDCALFASGGRAALTGTDVLAPVRGCYSTLEEGFELAARHGYASPFDAVVDGLEEIPPAYAQVGDLALLEGDDGHPAMGIVQGELVCVLHPRGVAMLPLTDVRRAWRV